jgi:hypothetical protein
VRARWLPSLSAQSIYAHWLQQSSSSDALLRGLTLTTDTLEEESVTPRPSRRETYFGAGSSSGGAGGASGAHTTSCLPSTVPDTDLLFSTSRSREPSGDFDVGSPTIDDMAEIASALMRDHASRSRTAPASDPQPRRHSRMRSYSLGAKSQFPDL